jgi:hypothetical protein
MDETTPFLKQGEIMIRRKARLLAMAGSFVLALGIASRLWLHGSHAAFTSGFLIGFSLVLLLFGFVQMRRASS